MSKRKDIKLITQTFIPNALIVGGGMYAGYLSRVLQEKGCRVDTSSTHDENFQRNLQINKYQYAFIFDEIKLAEQIYKKNLVEKGNMLLVLSKKEINSADKENSKIKTVDIGDLTSWNMAKLTEKLLKIMFSSDNKNFLSIAKNKKVKRETKKTTESNIPVKPKISKIHSNTKKEKSKKKKSTSKVEVRKTFGKKRLVAVIFVLIAVFGIFSSFLYFYIRSIETTVHNFSSHFAASDLKELKNDFETADRQIKIAKFFYDISYKVLFPIRDTEIMRETGEMIYISNSLVNTGQATISYFDKFNLNNLKTKTQNKTITKTDFLEVEENINRLTSSILNAKNKIDEVQIPFFPEEGFSIMLADMFSKLNSFKELLPFVEYLIVSDSAKTYLVLLQNNMELRPTGGFIGSFGLLTIGAGKLYDFRIMDVYQADGQLKGHVDPPEPIRDYLNQPHWFLRDSNFDPDFLISAQRATWFLEKEINRRVDGVIGINLFLVQDVLSVIGPLEIKDFGNEIVTSANFFFKGQFYAQDNFFAGSNQKKDFLTAVTNEIETEMFSDKKISWIKILLAIKKSLDEKNMMVFTQDNSFQNFIEENGWAGRISKNECVSAEEDQTVNTSINNCYFDYLSINEANLGVNKVNYFMQKTITIEKKVESQGRVVNALTLSYENKSIPEVFQGGTYVNYLRIIVPKGSTLINSSLNGKNISSDEIKIQNYMDDKTVFGLLINIAPENKAILKFNYLLPETLNGNVKTYQFLYQKQGGDKISPFILSVSPASQVFLKPVNFQSSASSNQEVYFSTDTSVDRIFAFEIER